jgi:hypothetical protein
MAVPRTLTETILPLTNSRGFGKVLRFNYMVGPKQWLPLVVSPQILSMGDPFFTRQAIYFLSDADYAIRTYSKEVCGPTAGGEESRVSEIRTVADDCLFEYSLRNPASRLTTRSEFPPRRTRWDRTEITFKRPGESGTSYSAVDSERVLLTKESRRTFEQLFEALVGDIHDQDLGHQAFGEGADAFPLGLSPDDHATAPVKFKEMPYTFEELDLLSRFVPVDPEMIGRFSVSDLLKAERDDSSREAIVALLNQPYMEQIKRLPPAKWLEPEIIEVGHTYNPRLLDFYFAGLRSLSPVVEFKNYYNILEYYFDEGGTEKKSGEQDQIRQVIRDYVPLDRLHSFFDNEIPERSRHHFESFDGVVNGGKIEKIRISNIGLQSLVAKRIYSFRNAIFHSKRVYRGEATVVIRPCSKEEAEVVAHEVLLVRLVAQEIIKQSRDSE